MIDTIDNNTERPSADPLAEPILSRRRLLGGALLGGLWSQTPTLAGPPPIGSPLHWLVQRLTFGLTQEELTLAQTLGYTNYLEHHLNHTAIADGALTTRLSSYGALFDEPWQLLTRSGEEVMSQLWETTILRSVFSQRQLFERMVEFWSDHLSININLDNEKWMKMTDDRDVVRAHALGTFRGLMNASIRSPAMLYYLDNHINVAGNPNENYARELMELHTLGVDGGYSQQDVEEVARCFTGWTYHIPGQSSLTDRHRFRFNPAVHDNGPKRVLGVDIPAGGGINDGQIVLDILLTHPSTAQFIAKKLCRRFWGYNPPQSLIDSVAATYTATDGDIKAMLRTLFASTDPLTAEPKYKRPYHLFISALRATNATVNSTATLRGYLNAVKHVPFTWGPPDGFPDSLSAWLGNILPRWNYGLLLMQGNIWHVIVDVNAFFAGTTTADQMAQRIDERLFGGAMPTAQRTRIRDYLLPNPPTTGRKRDAIGLAIASPGYQWY